MFQQEELNLSNEKRSERLESLEFKVEAQEKKHSINVSSINDINQKLTILTNDASHVKRDIHDIKAKLNI